MRESYVPLFQSTMTSSLWVHDSDTRIFWLSLLMMADPEGFVCGTLPGLALAANVPLDKARAAMALFEAPDPDSRTSDHDGRRVERVARGWRVINLVAARARAVAEAEKARKRTWARANRGRDHEPPATPEEPAECDLADREEPPRSEPVAGRSETVDAPKPRPSSPPPPPIISNQREEEGPRFHDLDGFEPSPGLVAYAERYGLPPMALHARLEKLRKKSAEAMRRVFGPQGVRDREQWCRDQLPTWKRWWLENGGSAEPLPVERRPPKPAERPSSPAPVGECVPMPEELLRFVATGVLPPPPARAAPARPEVAA